MKKFVKVGGEIKIKVPDVNDINNTLSGNDLAISIMTHSFLFHKTPNFSFHYNVITGIDDKNIYLNDPSGTCGGKVSHAIQDFFYSVFSTTYKGVGRGSILVVSK